MSNRILCYIISFMISFSSIACTQEVEPVRLEPPDLTVQSVSTKKLSNIHYDQYNNPVIGNGNELEVTLQVKNSGSGDFYGKIYLDHTEYDINNYSGSSLLTSDPISIPKEGSMELISHLILAKSVVRCKLRITSIADTTNNSVQTINENNLENNTYVILVP